MFDFTKTSAIDAEFILADTVIATAGIADYD